MATQSLDELAVVKGNTFVWHQLDVPNAQAAIDFYTKVFGFGVESMDMAPQGQPGSFYHILTRDGKSVAGIMGIPREMQGMPSRWAPFFGVDDVDATLAKCKGLGGKSIVDPMDIPQVGRMALVEDNQGVSFWIYKPTPSMA